MPVSVVLPNDMTLKVCAEPGCPKLVNRTRCQAHERAKDAARGRRQDRGYDRIYDQTRRSYQQRMDAGERFTCWRCAELGRPHEVDPTRWHLGHDNDDRDVIRGPQCPESNLATASARRTTPL